MKIRKLTIAVVMLCLLSMIGLVAYAEYYFERVVQDAEVTLGTVSLGDYKFKSYAGTDSSGYTTERLDEAVDATVSASGRITCYASEKTGFIGESDYISLNQLGFEFSYTNTLDVYVRVQVQDAWISRKYYSGSSDAKDNYIKRDNTNRYIPATGVSATNVTNFFTITATKATAYDSTKTYYTLETSGSYVEASVGSSTSFTDNTYYTLAITKATSYSSTTKYYYNANSPFSVQNENWVYDNATGCIYYKLVSEASETEKTISFDIDENYVYVSDSNTIGYREAILVEVGFNIDIVQANRAHAVWGIDMDSYFD